MRHQEFSINCQQVFFFRLFKTLLRVNVANKLTVQFSQLQYFDLNHTLLRNDLIHESLSRLTAQKNRLASSLIIRKTERIEVCCVTHFLLITDCIIMFKHAVKLLRNGTMGVLLRV